MGRNGHKKEDSDGKLGAIMSNPQDEPILNAIVELEAQLDGLVAQEQELANRIDQLRGMLTVPLPGARRGRLTPEARAKISKGQQRRWAERRQILGKIAESAEARIAAAPQHPLDELADDKDNTA